MGRLARVLMVLCIAFLIAVMVGWALGLVHITGIHATTITPPARD